MATTIIEPTGTNEPEPASNGADMNQLREMQKQAFGRKGKEKSTPTEDTKEDGDSTTDAPENKDRAAEIFERNQRASEKTKTIKEEPEEESGEDPEGFKPISTFLKLEEEKAAKKEDAPAEEKKTDTAEIDVDKEGNIKNLRTIVKDFKQKHKDAEARVQQLEQELAAKKPSSALETENLKLKERVQKLEQYELVFGLHDNPDFKREYIDSANSIVSEMTEIATDYGVEPEVVQEILNATTRKELDEILAENFTSLHPQNDLKELRQKYVGISKERAKRESKPGETLADYNQRKEQMELENNRRREDNLKQAADEGWKLARQAVFELPEEQKIYELIEVAGQKEHNEKVVRPTLKHANDLTNYLLGHVETLIRNKGMPTRAFAAWVAQLMQQAAATQMLRDSRQGLYKKFTEMEEELGKQSDYDRPALNGSSRSQATNGKDKPKSTEERLAQTFINVTSRDERA